MDSYMPTAYLSLMGVVFHNCLCKPYKVTVSFGTSIALLSNMVVKCGLVINGRQLPWNLFH